ncbi:MAG: SDR family NAD(P)-dependent oxidoreductase, partial [Spirochaetales bacterium]|nr:SDR family NAD(P)-dependent oxidoreductase [Spirochaetales bacterium]
MNTRTYIVTGGNAGIGKAIAAALARMNQRVVIVSRSREKGEKALGEIAAAGDGSSVHLVVGDLGSIRNVKMLAEELSKKYPAASVLINNAGVWPNEFSVNEDGLEYSFMVNHMAPLILCAMLLETLRSNAPARIVNVNAGLYDRGAIDLDKTPFGRDFGRLKTYMNTKLCNIYFTRKFSKIIGGRGVTINAVHPGVIRTNLVNAKGAAGRLLGNVVKRFFASPAEGAEAPVRLAAAPELEGVNGKYFDLKTEKPHAANARDDELMEK